MTHSRVTAVVIPTRNRSDLAMNAIRSVLDQPVDDVRVIVSDNSTAERDKIALADFCRQLSDPRLLYIQPPQALGSMAEHWDWAMQQALQLREIGYFIYLTDRSMFKPGELAAITKLSRLYPDKVVSYDWVTIFDHLSPIFVEPQQQTGRLVEVSASWLLFLSSQSIFPNCLPRMMNCCVPRSVIEAMKNRFGNVFASIGPDYNFCYRCLEVVDSILYYDKNAYVSYAIPRSNGVYLIGISTDANRDFFANLAPSIVPASFAPVPAFETFVNYVIHEYCFVQQETASPNFPAVDRGKYLARNASDAASNQNLQLKREMKALLKAHGYSVSVKQRLSQLRGRLSLRTRAQKVLNLQWPAVPDKAGPFESVEEAIDYAINVPLNGDSNPYHLRLLRE